MRTADEWFDAYGESHQNPTNKAIHLVCVPVILFTTVGLFWSIPRLGMDSVLPGQAAPYLNWGSLLVLGSLIFYARLSSALALGMAVVSAIVIGGLLVIESVSSMPLWQVCTIVFVIAWVGQFIGHKIEGKKPSFFEDLQFLMIGPIWLLGFIYRKLGIAY
ncbi:MAG: Mpo1-like protein [Myxococcota bacterium]|nr:Mpo1-like protein [Myxococcota bacterium]